MQAPTDPPLGTPDTAVICQRPRAAAFPPTRHITATRTHPKLAPSCHYVGTLIDGTEFDSSYKRGRPSRFAPNQVLAGWSEAMQVRRAARSGSLGGWLEHVPERQAPAEQAPAEQADAHLGTHALTAPTPAKADGGKAHSTNDEA